MTTFNEAFFDESLRHATDVRRFTIGEVAAILELLEKADQQLVKKLRSRIGPRFTMERLQNLLKDLGAARAVTMSALRARLRGRLADFAKQEVEFEAGVVQTVVPFKVELATVNLNTLQSAIFNRPFEGAPLRGWFKTLEVADMRNLSRALQTGIANGESVDQMVRRVAGTRARRFADGALSMTRRNAEAVVRTSVNHVSNTAREVFWDANEDIIQALRWTSTLDGRTCLVAESKVLSSNGDWRNIKDIEVGDMVVGGVSGQPRCVTGRACYGEKVTVLVETVDGGFIQCTPDHLFLTPIGWAEARSLCDLGLPVRGASESFSRDESEVGRSRISGHDGCQAPNPVVQSENERKESGFVFRSRVAGYVEREIRPRDGWTEIASVRYSGRAPVYDIEVEEDHSFVCAGVVVHNSAICQARDGALKPVGDKPLPNGARRLDPPDATPPAHPNCRSVLVAVLDGEGLLGSRPFITDKRRPDERIADFRAEARRSGKSIVDVRKAWQKENVGTLPAETTYNEWLGKQSASFQDEVLGKTKGALFRRGDLSLDKFVDRRGNELTITDLRGRHPGAFDAANI